MLKGLTPIQESEFKTVAMVNMTALLVLTTLFIGITNSLPKTASIKLIEFWLLGHLMVPFFQVILHTIIDFLREEVDHIKPKMTLARNGHQDAKEQVLGASLTFGRFGFPIIYVNLCAVFVAYGMTAN